MQKILLLLSVRHLLLTVAKSEEKCLNAKILYLGYGWQLPFDGCKEKNDPWEVNFTFKNLMLGLSHTHQCLSRKRVLTRVGWCGIREGKEDTINIRERLKQDVNREQVVPQINWTNLHTFTLMSTLLG